MDACAPDWVRDAVFYQIFPDRFARGGSSPAWPNLEPWDSPPTPLGFKGGDLWGVTERLDYLQDLGVNALYFNPIFASASNHRYHTVDYYSIDPLLGGRAAYDALIRECSRRGVRVILDGVFNHVGRGFYAFHHLLEAGQASPYVDWFHVHGWPLRAYDGEPNYECWWNMPALPKLNVANPAVREFLLQVAEYWLGTGASGWRLDVPSEIEAPNFWQEFRQRTKAANPEAYLVGEIWDDPRDWLRGDRFDASMNYPLAQHLLSFAGGTHIDRAHVHAHFRTVGEIDADTFMRRAGGLVWDLPPDVAAMQFNLLGSHDTPRFMSAVGGDRAAVKLASLLLITWPGVPCVYYGDEIGMLGGQDPSSRGGFPWDSGAWDADLRSHIQRLISLRRARPALRRGELLPLAAQGKTLAFARRLEGETLVVVANAGEDAAQLDLPLADSLGKVAALKDVWSGERNAAVEGTLRDIRIAPRSGTVLEVEK